MHSLWLLYAAMLQVTPWMFDFDANHADDPAAVNAGLAELGDGLPQPPQAQLSEVVLDDVRLAFFREMLEVYEQARAAGPDLAGPFEREAILCATHQAFSVPSLVADSGGTTCSQSAREITDILNHGVDSCLYTEFPELYVYDHPGGVLLGDTLNTFEGLIAYAGEALTHPDDYPVNLMVPGFWDAARGIIAKLRFSTLRDGLDRAARDYGRAQSMLTNGCFDSGVAAVLSSDLDLLITEALAVRASLVALVEAGLAEAAADRAALQAMGRRRADLPYPALADWEREFLSFWVAGIYWRMRGGGLINNPPEPGNSTLRRSYYVQEPFEVIAEMMGSPADVASVALFIFIDENWGYAEWYDMGSDPGSEDAYYDLVYMTKRGKRAVSMVEPLLAGRGFDTAPLMAGALQMGPCYYYSWEAIPNFRVGPDLQDPYLQFLEWPTAVGEFCTGATLALGLARTLLRGTECQSSCAGRACGDDGCGGSCGGCGAGTICQGGSCVGCQPSCAGRECGDDGCGSSCGVCGAGEICAGGTCDPGACQPSCSGRQCGSDGCGGSCGSCAVGAVCRDGGCVACQPDCGSRQCGDDGCGGECGFCAEGEGCRDGRCEVGRPEEGSGCDAAAGSIVPMISLVLLAGRRRRLTPSRRAGRS